MSRGLLSLPEGPACLYLCSDRKTTLKKLVTAVLHASFDSHSTCLHILIVVCCASLCLQQAFKKLVTDVSELEGLPPTALGLAAQQARSAGHDKATAEAGPWLLTLDFPSYYPVLTHAKNRCGAAFMPLCCMLHALCAVVVAGHLTVSAATLR
jgi:hypothetical protein